MNTETAPRPPPPPLILSLTSSSTTTAVSPASTSTTAPKAANANANNGDGTSLSEALAHSVADYVCAKTQQHQKNTNAGQQGGGVSSTTQQPCPSNIVTKGQQRQMSSPSSSCVAPRSLLENASATAPEETAATVVKATTTKTATTATTAISAPPAAEAAKTPSPSKALPSAASSNQCEKSPGEQAALPRAQPIPAAVAATKPPTPPEPVAAAACSTSLSTPRTAPPTFNTSIVTAAPETAPTSIATPLTTPNATTTKNPSSAARHSSPEQILKSAPNQTSTTIPSSHFAHFQASRPSPHSALVTQPSPPLLKIPSSHNASPPILPQAAPKASQPTAPAPATHHAPRPPSQPTQSPLPPRAPIISGTAAAILALQTVSFDHRSAPAVVSTNSSYSGGGGGSEECCCHGDHRVNGCVSVVASSSRVSPSAMGGTERSTSGNSPLARGNAGPIVVGKTLDVGEGRWVHRGRDDVDNDSTDIGTAKGAENAIGNEYTPRNSNSSPGAKSTCHGATASNAQGGSGTSGTRTSDVQSKTTSSVITATGPSSSSVAASITATNPTTAISTTTSKKAFPSRYSDGAPIIAGTAAAQMAIATAARIAASRRDGCSGMPSSISSAVGAISMTMNMNIPTRNVTAGTSMSHAIAEMNHYNFSEDMSQFGSAMEKLSSVGKIANMDSQNRTNTSAMSSTTANVANSANVVNSASSRNNSTMTRKPTEARDELSSRGKANDASTIHGKNRATTTVVSSPPPPGKGVKSALLSKSTSCQIKKNTPTKALSWVDHAPRVTPEDFSANHRHSTSKRTPSFTPCEDSGNGSAVSSVLARQLSNPSHSQQVPRVPSEHHRTPAAPTPSASMKQGASSSAPSPGGGMDILADIISHVPPMIVPTSQRQSASNSVPMACQSVTAADSGHSPLHLSQQQQQTLHQSTRHYSGQFPSQHQQQQQQQLLHHTLYSSGQPTSSKPMHYQIPTAKHTTVTHRVSAIPSYQEIYQEMRQMEQSTSSHPQHSTDQRHYTPMEVDNPTPATTSDATQQYYPSQPQHLQYHSQEPTSIREPPITSTCTSYSVEEVLVPMQCVVETVEPPPPTKTTLRPPTTHFGHAEGGEIVEGKELYTRKDLAITGGHALEHKDVHGNMKEGADSIIVSHLERDLREGDGLCWLLFSCDRTNGGGALCRSYHKKRAIRVFRSSLLGGRFSAPYLDEDEDDEIGYRYDGLYMVKAVWDVNGNETETFPTTGVEGWQTFFFTRLPKKPLDAKDVEPGMQYNQLGLQELWGSIQKMRGVKRPKKFEIPPVPAKLPPFKRGAITGENKDRKAMAYKPPPKPEPKQEDNQEMDLMIVNTKTSRNTRQPESEESCDSSADENPNKTEAEKSESVTSHHHSQHTSQLSDNEKTSRRLSMSRPRMLCIPNPVSQSTHRKRGEPDNDADSSESDESSAHFQDHKKSPVTKRKKSDEPLVNTKVSTPSKKPDVLVDSSSYFPKRTSAAKAEAANRDLLSKPKKPNNKRKSATPNSRGGGKKAKKVVEEEEVDEYSSEEDIVDQASLTVGSRVLVMYKGSLFKATIRKRREKNGRHDFLIHYDGNKKSNVHWVPIDRIPEIISLAVNVTSSKKTAPKRKGSSTKQTAVKRSSSNDDDDSSDDENKENELSPRESRSSHEVDNESKESRVIDGIVVAEENISSSNKVSASIENIRPVKKLEADSIGSIPRPESACTGECSESVNRVSPEESLSPKTNLTTIDSSTQQSKAEESTTHCNISHMSEIAPDQLSSNMAPPDFIRSTVRTDICDAEPVENLTSTQLPLKTTPGESNENNHSSNSSDTASSEKRENESSGKSSTLSSVADDDEASADVVEGPSSNGSDHISKEVVKSQVDGVKFPVGCKVYVEYRHIFYSSTILKTRKKKAAHEYLVHYQGYKKASNRWVKEDTLHEVNEATTKRYEEQRLIPAHILYGTDQTEFSMVTRRKKAAEESNSSPSKLKHRGSRIDVSELADLGDIEPGVAFLPGSVVFVEWSGALYLAKMLKKRFSGDRMEYMVSYDGYESDFDAWVSIHKIYEVDHQSKKVFKRLKSDMLPQPPPGPKRETRSSLEAETLAAPTPKRESRRKKEDDIVSDFDMSSKANGEVRQVESQIDMQGIPSGVEFLPGSTLFAERNRGLCLAKMLKKRGKGDYMEYFIQYMGLKKEETRWISTALVFEINPQTKRMYRLYSGKKKS